jgi:hypothetical protein
MPNDATRIEQRGNTWQTFGNTRAICQAKLLNSPASLEYAPAIGSTLGTRLGVAEGAGRGAETLRRTLSVGRN